MSLQKEIEVSLKKYQGADNRRAFLILLQTLVPLPFIIGLSFYLYEVNPLLSCLLWPLLVVFFSRLFIIEHDCGHLAFFKEKNKNVLFGELIGFITLIPYSLFRSIHNMHHANLAKLEKRDANPELWTLTIEEYKNASYIKKLAYRIMRSSISRILITPLALFIINRLPNHKVTARVNLLIILSDILYFFVFYFLIRNELLLTSVVIYFLPLLIFYVFAILIFHLQHQFEDTFWANDTNWSHFDASMKGCSYLKLPPLFRWISLNIGYHHIHHFNPKIPGYKLKDAGVELDKHLKITPIKFSDFFHHLSCKVWDPSLLKLVPIPKNNK